MLRSVLVMSMLVTALGCGDPSIVDGKNYPTTCTQATDCAAVFLGSQCAPCSCPNAAIASTAKVTYDADRSAALATCGPRAAIACAPCMDPMLTCMSGVCGLK